MSQPVRLVLFGCALIVVLGWLKQQLNASAANVGGGSTALSIGLLVAAFIFGVGLVARAFGLGPTVDPERRRREAGNRTVVRRSVDADHPGAAWDRYELERADADGEGAGDEGR